MSGNRSTDISKFFVVGINYKKTDASIRGLFAVGNEQYENILLLAPSFGIHELFVLSTCNRTEIYGFAEEVTQLTRLLCTQTPGISEIFTELAYIKNGFSAITHLFHVGAGLDSQILGDYEIVGQIKQSVKLSKEKNSIGTFLERLVNAVLQSSKVIKNKTALSGGTVSVSFAAVQYIKEKIPVVAGKNILLLGTGKIGRNTCKNLVDYLSAASITLINRTEEKAAELAGELGLKHAAFEELPYHIKKADIILVATNASDPTILKTYLENNGNKLIIDLSIPCNVEKDAQELPNITFVDVDELSKLKDETLQKRKAEIPKAKAIIRKHMDEFMEWQEMRKHGPVLKAVKYKLQAMHSCKLFMNHAIQHTETAVPAPDTEAKIQKVINVMALKMRHQNQRGCQYIEAINDYIACGAN
jgi:glutamyl-tRNA reductase